MATIGRVNKLTVVKQVDFGTYLDGEELGEILLPRKYEPENIDVGDSLHVFLYFDSEGRPIATTQKSKIALGEFAYLKAVTVNEHGAFLDWGLDKDLFVPEKEQHRPMEAGKSYLVYAMKDRVNGKIIATSKINTHVKDEAPADLKSGDEVDLIVANSTDLGFKVIVNHQCWGVLYNNEVFQRLSFGQYKKGFVKSIRADKRLDVSLQGGQQTRDKYRKIIENYLNKNQGFAPVHDKSDPKVISDIFGMSKGAFKKAIGGMYKDKVISIEKDGIRLL